jgi:sterol desaturase/sphingolipid hydroxylase (fatty acid hydroxylase superfamily)
MNRKFISNSQESIRMFSSDLLESVSKVHYSIPLLIYVPVILTFVCLALMSPLLKILYIVLLYAGGIATWSFIEYTLHRYVFHFHPESDLGKKIHFIFHGVHHDYPNDKLRLVMPPSVSIPLAFGFYYLFNMFIPTPYLYPFFAGLVSGYLFYDISHYAIHHFNFRNKFWVKMKKHHMQHHYKDENKGFGVTSGFWDEVFKSNFDKQ